MTTAETERLARIRAQKMSRIMRKVTQIGLLFALVGIGAGYLRMYRLLGVAAVGVVICFWIASRASTLSRMLHVRNEYDWNHLGEYLRIPLVPLLWKAL